MATSNKSNKTQSSEKEMDTRPCSAEQFAEMQRKMNELLESNQIALEYLSQLEKEMEQTSKEFYEEIKVVNNFFEDFKDTERQEMVKYDEILLELDEEFDNVMDSYRKSISSKKQAREEYLIKKQGEAEQKLDEILYKLENTVINVHKEGSVKTFHVKDYGRMDPKSVRNSVSSE